ncbi:MAG: hypothetical protein JNL69_02965 [Bacteroidia bacterium]|nr:hypothetical protein [Bacteroidia bacterium]
MKKTNYIFLLFILFVLVNKITGQTDTVINGKKYKMVEEPVVSKNGKIKKRIPPLDSMFVINNKKFKYYNNWVTAGAGTHQNLSYKRALGFTVGLDYNFHIKQHYFQLGTNILGERFGFYTNYQFHLGYGKRFEDKDIHFAAFGGLSYSSGYGKVDTLYSRHYSEPGIYVQAEFVKKITWDVGIGASLFADINQEQSLVGLRLVLYFSGAYKGDKYGRKND